MVGVPMRSGGHNASAGDPAGWRGDGCPESPRELSPAAAGYFAWLVERLSADQEGGPWCRVDGCLLASLADLLEAEERLGTMLTADPFNERLMRLRMQHCDRVAKLSALIGLCPRDRARVPGPAVDEEESAFNVLLERMGGRV